MLSNLFHSFSWWNAAMLSNLFHSFSCSQTGEFGQCLRTDRVPATGFELTNTTTLRAPHRDHDGFNHTSRSSHYDTVLLFQWTLRFINVLMTQNKKWIPRLLDSANPVSSTMAKMDGMKCYSTRSAAKTSHKVSLTTIPYNISSSKTEERLNDRRNPWSCETWWEYPQMPSILTVWYAVR